MKRSEMIKKVYGALWGDYSQDTIDVIMKYLEKQGMQPPRDPITLLNKWEAEETND